MKFTPIAASSPREEARTFVFNDIAQIELNIIHDPKNGNRYLSFGIGTTNVRRTWLTANQTMLLMEKIATLAPKLWSE